MTCDCNKNKSTPISDLIVSLDDLVSHNKNIPANQLKKLQKPKEEKMFRASIQAY